MNISMTRRTSLLLSCLVFTTFTLAPVPIAHAASVTIIGGSYASTDVNGDIQTRIPTNPSNAVLEVATFTNQTAMATYSLSNSGFTINMSHARDGIHDGLNHHFAESSGQIHFSITPGLPGGALTYSALGDYAVTDNNVSSPGFVYLASYVVDNTTSTPLFRSEQLSQNTPNQNFALGGTAGDTYNSLTGSGSGTLIAGHAYTWYYDSIIDAYPDADDGASATGNFTLAFTDSSLPTASPDATPATPLPAAAFLPLPLLALLPFLRRRSCVWPASSASRAI